MADSLNVVPVWANNESTVVVRVVVLSNARRSVVRSACSERCLMELANLFPVVRCKGNVDRPRTTAIRTKPELRPSVSSHHGPSITLAGDANAKGLKCVEKEILARREVADVETDVIQDHRVPP
jgi:hypothetical protein